MLVESEAVRQRNIPPYIIVIRWLHPGTGQEMFFSVPVPADMQALMDKWRSYSPANSEINQK